MHQHTLHLYTQTSHLYEQKHIYTRMCCIHGNTVCICTNKFGMYTNIMCIRTNSFSMSPTSCCICEHRYTIHPTICAASLMSNPSINQSQGIPKHKSVPQPCLETFGNTRYAITHIEPTESNLIRLKLQQRNDMTIDFQKVCYNKCF